MRFNKQELLTLATQPSQKFEKEGVLYVRERQEGFFRRTESTGKNLENKRQKGKTHKTLRDLSCVTASTSKVNLERWCRLRGNLLFYFKSREQWSEPLGVIILEQCCVRLDQPTNQIPYGFSIVFDGGLFQQLGANTAEERDSWLQALQLASYECMRSQLLALRERIEAFSGHKHDTDIHMLRLQRGIFTDPAEIPMCEVSLACDNLLCDGHGRPPNPVLEVDVQLKRSKTWIKYARTEVVERSSNPGFLTTISFRASDGLSSDTKVRITAYDVRERVSQTATPIGSSIVTFNAIQDTPRLRIPLKSAKTTTVGFLTINVWNLEAEDKGNSTESTPSRNIPSTNNQQRGSDELLSQSGAVSNGAAMSPQPHHAADNNNDAKKVKLDKSHNGKPSKVVHIRNIPNEVSEAEIIHLGLPFGRVTNVLVLKGKNQAFLEMADENAAATMVTYYASCIAQLRGRAVYVQFSNHRELKTDQAHSNNAVSSPTNDEGHASKNSSNQVAIPGQNQVSSQAETQGGPNTVLRVIVEHMIYPISLDILYQIFTRFGKVLKIVTFTKNSSFQALIQYADMVAAQTAKFSLDGQNIYNSCCTLRIDYSKMQNLNVKYNNDKSRDYTNPNLPTGDANIDAASLALGGELLPQILMGAGSQPRARIPEQNLQENHSVFPPMLESIAGAPGVLPTPFAAMHGLPSPLAGPYNGVPPAGGLGGLGGFPLGAGALGVRVPGGGQSSAVLLVSNLNEEMVTPDALFTLFGVYGDVQRVKILYNKKDSALIQMAEPHQAHLAITHMDKLRVFGKQIKVVLSKHQTVQLPKEGQPDAGLTKDYTSSPLHRFKKPGSKNYQNIYPPSSTLHLSNIPATVTEEEIKDAFSKNGFNVKAFKFFPKDRKMALIQLLNMDDAVAALIKMHNFQLSESNHLRVSFSKSNI